MKLYGDREDENPQYLAETSHTTPQGNTEYNVDLALFQDGLVVCSSSMWRIRRVELIY